VAPLGVPKPAAALLAITISKGLEDPTFREKLSCTGATPVGGTPEQFTAFVKSESTRWADVVKRTGAKVD
jgi:tripartite-type tricarboxylate transporter receptor subunit TctC